MLKIETTKRKCRARIAGEMTIYKAAELKEQLLPVLTEARDLEIDLANVGEIDSAGVQLLMLAKKELGRKGKNLTLANHSAAVLDAFELTGLLSYFNDPVVLTRSQGEKHGS